MNIHYDSNYASQSSLPANATFNSITSNDYIINGASAGDLLFTNANKEINGLAIGPQNYVLQSSGVEPQWSNTLNVNSITTVALKIPGTSHGDLFTVDNNNFFERVPIGSNGSILLSVGSQYQWQSYSGGQLFSDGGIITSEATQAILGQGITNLPGTFQNVLTYNVNLVNTKNYKITISGNVSTTGNVYYQLVDGNNSNICLGTISGNADLHRTSIYYSFGNTSLNLLAYSDVIGSAINGFNMLVERYV